MVADIWLVHLNVFHRISFNLCEMIADCCFQFYLHRTDLGETKPVYTLLFGASVETWKILRKFQQLNLNKMCFLGGEGKIPFSLWKMMCSAHSLRVKFFYKSYKLMLLRRRLIWYVVKFILFFLSWLQLIYRKYSMSNENIFYFVHYFRTSAVWL